jgi:glycine/D-amino acid oxidase-like deaminating enzyme
MRRVTLGLLLGGSVSAVVLIQIYRQSNPRFFFSGIHFLPVVHCHLFTILSEPVRQAGQANVYLATEHGALGWTHGNACGRLVAGQLLGEKPAIEPAPFPASGIF